MGPANRPVLWGLTKGQHEESSQHDQPSHQLRKHIRGHTTMTDREYELEVLDATDPAVTARVQPVVLRAFLWLSSSFVASSVALGVLLAADIYMWVVVGGHRLPVLPLLAVCLVAGASTYAFLLWCNLTFRWHVHPGDHWYVLTTSEGQAVALVQPRPRGLLIASLAAVPKGCRLGRRLLLAIVARAHAADQTVVCDAMLDNVQRYRRWGLLPDGRIWWTLWVMARLRSRPRIEDESHP